MTPREGLWFRRAGKGVPLGSGWVPPPKSDTRQQPLGAVHTTSSVTGMGFSWGPLETPAAASSSSSLGFLRASAGGRGGGLLGGCLMVPPTCGRSLGLDSMGVHCSPRVAACRTQSGGPWGASGVHPQHSPHPYQGTGGPCKEEGARNPWVLERPPGGHFQVHIPRHPQEQDREVRPACPPS